MTRRRLILCAAAGLLGAAVLIVAVDRRGRSRSGSDRVRTVDGDGLEIVAVAAEPLHAVAGQPVQLTVAVEHGRDAGGKLRYRWEAKKGRFDEATAAAATWTAPPRPGRHTVRVTVEDGDNTAHGSVTIEVRLPSPRALARLGDLTEERAADVEADAARLAAIDARLAELETVAARGETISDLLRAQEALEEMATLLEEAGRYREARGVWDRLLVNMLPGGSKYAAFQARLGDVAFMLGDEDAALRAWNAGGDYTDSLSRYYQGHVLERRGDRAGALAAYALAEGGLRWFGDPLYRQALLMLEDGADPEAVAALLVAASPRLDRDRMLQRFASDPDTAPLRRVLEETGHIHDLVHQEPLTVESGGPGRAAAPGGG